MTVTMPLDLHPRDRSGLRRMQACALVSAPWKDPLAVLASFAEEPYALGLISDGSERGRWSYLAWSPTAVFGDLETWRALMPEPPLPADPDPEHPPFQGGAAGLACYEWGAANEAAAPQDRSDWPDLAGGVYDRLLAFDHHRRRVWAVGRGADGVEADRAAADAMTRSLAAGQRVTLDQVGLFADGVAVKQVGELPFQICRQHVDEMIRVSTDEMCAAIKDVFEENRSILEPSGALAVAGLKAWAAAHSEGGTPAGGTPLNLAAILSGANTQFDRLRFVAERAELGEHREAIFAATIPERPGSFKAFCEIIGQRAITEFNYRYADADRAHIFVGLQVASRTETADVLSRLRAQDIDVLDLSEDELAKLHIRHLVGGRAPAAKNELVYRFEFPERPGALLKFLTTMSRGWNISLFHYRNHGADYGRVLVGIQVPPEEEDQFQTFLQKLGYVCTDERDNLAYRLFLA